MFAGIVLLSIVYYLDHYSPSEVTFLFLYFLVVVFVAIKHDGVASFVFAAVASYLRTTEAMQMVGDLQFSASFVWALLNLLGVFSATTYLIHRQLRYINRIKLTSLTDPLTKLGNRRSFQHDLEAAVAHCKRHLEPLSVAYIDVDNFKKINDERGHNTGDCVLSLIAEIIRNLLRAEDRSGRLGGDEFAIIFWDTDEGAIKHSIERIKFALDRAMSENKFDVTFSIGCVTLKGRALVEANALLHDADQLMYQVKKDAKNGIRYMVLD